MISYGAEELVASSEMAKKFGHYLAKVGEQGVDKLAILKNNKVEAIILSKENYEAIYAAAKRVSVQDYITSIERGLHDMNVGKTYKIESLWSALDD